MKNRAPEGPHSAVVRLWLECSGKTIPLAQVAPDWVIPREPRLLPPGEAVVVVEIDGHPRRRPVFLPQGMSSTPDQVVPTSPRPAVLNEAVP